MRKLSAKDHGIGASIAFVYLLWLYKTAKTLGFSRDESFYFDAGSRYAAWFKLVLSGAKGATERATVDAHWAMNHEHPSLVKSSFALSYLFLHEKWKLVHDASQAFRLPGMLFAGLALYVVYLFGAKLYSRTAGIAGAFALALMPRVFYHAHLACFDVPATAMWGTTLYVYLRATERRTVGSAILFGLVYGLFLETKHNAWMFPGVVVPHVLWAYDSSKLFKKASWADGSWKREIPLPVIAMAILGPLVFVALWPWMWNDTLPRIEEYAKFHLNHEYYNMEYLGRNYAAAPSPPSFAPVMIVATVPTITLVLFVVGVGPWLGAAARYVRARLVALRQKSAAKIVPPRDAEIVLLLGFVVPIAVFFLPKTPIFGATKHWMPAYVAMAVFAGRGFAAIVARFRKMADRNARGLAVAATGTALFLGPLLLTSHSHPFGLSAYTPIVGGTRGAATLGLNRQFWGFTTQSLAPFLRDHARPGETVFIHDTTMGAWGAMQYEKRIRQDLRANVWSISDADLAIVHHELHMFIAEANMMTAYRTAVPVYVLDHDGVPIVTVYAREPH